LERVLWQADNGGDALAIIGLDADTTPADVQKTYLNMVRLLHPDQPVFIKKGLTVEATRAMAALNQAHAQLMSGKAPTNGTGQQTKVGTNPTDDASVAAGLIEQARTMLNGRAWARAEDNLRQARQLLQGRLDSRCDVLLAWAIWNNADRDADQRDEEALTLWKKVIDRQGERRHRALAHFYMAVRLRSRGREDRAIVHAEKAVDLDPRLHEADSLLRLLLRREERGQGRGGKEKVGFWARLLGRD